jgi:hypothetical protein
VAGAIVRAGGRSGGGDRRAPVGLGDAIETTAGTLPARWVIRGDDGARRPDLG